MGAQPPPGTSGWSAWKISKFDEGLGSKQQEAEKFLECPGHFHIFLSGYSWCLLIFGTILMVQLVLSFLELKPHFPRFLFAYKESTMIHVFCKNALIPYDQNNLVKFQLVASLPVTLSDLWGCLHPLKKGLVASTMSFKIGSEPRSASKTPRFVDRFLGGFKKMATWLHRVGSSAADWSRSWRA